MHIDVIQVKGENVTIAIPTDRMIVFFFICLVYFYFVSSHAA